MRDLNDPLDDFGTVSLNRYGKVYIDSIINVENQNYFYLEDFLETELGGVPEDTRADMMAFFTMVQGVRSSERYVVKAVCNDSSIVDYAFGMMKNTTRTYEQNYTVTCGGYNWSWASGTKILTVLPSSELARRLLVSGSNIDHIVNSRDLSAFGSECSVPLAYSQFPVASCVLDTFYVTGFFGFQYPPEDQPDVSATDIGNAVIIDRLDAAETIVVYNQQGATLSIFVLPVLWFIGLILFGRWDQFHKERIYEGKKHGDRFSGAFVPLSKATYINKKQKSEQIQIPMTESSPIYSFNVDSVALEDYRQISSESSSSLSENDQSATFSDMFGSEQYLLLGDHSSLQRFIDCLLREHRLFSMWSFPSIAVPRRIRYLAFWSHLLTIFFSNTLIIITFARLRRDCTVSVTEAECTPSLLSDSTSIVDSSFMGSCVWDDARSECKSVELPSSFLFTVTCTFATLLLATCINSFLWHFFGLTSVVSSHALKTSVCRPRSGLTSAPRMTTEKLLS
jgi:hypothetical protein